MPIVWCCYICQKLKLVARVKVCFSIHCINKVSVDLTHYSLPLVQIHTHQMYTYLVSFGQQVQVEGHIWPSLSNVPCTTIIYILLCPMHVSVYVFAHTYVSVHVKIDTVTQDYVQQSVLIHVQASRLARGTLMWSLSTHNWSTYGINMANAAAA